MKIIWMCKWQYLKLCSLSQHSRIQFLILEEITVSIVFQEKKQKKKRKRGGKAAHPTGADHKVPSYAINPSPPAVWYHRVPVSDFLTLIPPSFLCHGREKASDRQIDAHAAPNRGPNAFSFLPLFSTACRYSRWRVCEAWNMESEAEELGERGGNENGHNQIPCGWAGRHPSRWCSAQSQALLRWKLGHSVWK